MILTTLALCASLAPMAAAPARANPAAAAAKAIAIRAEHVNCGDGRVLDKATIVIENGKISAVGTAVDVPAGVGVLDHAGTVSAGMVALHGYSGTGGDVRETARPALPSASVGMVFDATRADLVDAVKAGVTTVVITPAPHQISGGCAAVVKTSGGVRLLDPAWLSLNFSASGLLSNREPTSYGGQIQMLEKLFEDPAGNVRVAANGKLPCLFETGTRPEVQRVLEFAKRHGLKGAIHGADLAGELAKEIKASQLAVILPAFGLGEDQRTLKAAVALQKAGVVFGFGLDAPMRSPAMLRIAAAQCLREGMSPEAAWKALTSDAAVIAGVEGRVGRIEKGLDADLVLWSGDPLDLGSRVVAVYVDGERVYGEQR